MRDRDFRGSLEEIWRRVVEGEPVALARFGDGELALMNQQPVGGQAGGVSALGEALTQTARNPDLIQGIPCSCCNDAAKAGLLEVCQGELTFANVFINGNWTRFCELVRDYPKPVFLIASNRAKQLKRLPVSVSGFYGIPGGCVAYFDQAREELKIEMGLIAKHWPGVLMLVAAGPLGTVLVDYLHQANPAIQALDIGSALDPWLFDYQTKPYQNPASAIAKKVCVR